MVKICHRCGLRSQLMEKMVGRVLGTKDATPLEFWVGVGEDEFIQLDDVVALERVLPTGEIVRMYGTVGQVIARHEGARFDSDVFLIEDGILPAEISEVAHVKATRFEPEIFVPPTPGQAVRIAEGDERDRALFFDRMDKKLPVGLPATANHSGSTLNLSMAIVALISTSRVSLVWQPRPAMQPSCFIPCSIRVCLATPRSIPRR